MNLSGDGIIDNPASSVFRLYGTFLFAFIVLFISRKLKFEKVPITELRMRAGYFIVFILPVAHHFLFHIRFLYREDGLMETATVILALLSSILLFLSSKRFEKFTCKAVVTMALFLILFALEELSWGQRLFGLKTPEFLKQINQQKETNIHNIVNFLIPLLYVIFFASLSMIFFFREKILDRISGSGKLSGLKKIIPDRSFYYFGYIFLFLAGYNLFRGGEITEEIFAVFVLFYSLDIFIKKTELKLR